MTRRSRQKTERAKKRREKNREGKHANIRVSFIVVVMAAVAIATGHLRETLSYAAAVILHELSHATVATRLGYRLTELKIMPYGAALTGEFEGARSRDEALIAIAGPLSNLIFAVLFIAVWWLVPSLFYYTEIYTTANLFTALINLLPLFPLDGGRVALALLSTKVPRSKAYKVMRIFGFIIGGAGVALAVINFKRLNFSYFTFLIFVLFSALIPDKSSKYSRLYEMSYRMEKIKTGLPVREILISKDTALSECLRLLGANYFTRFIITDEKLQRVALADETEIERFLTLFPRETPILTAVTQSNKIKNIG